MEEVYRIGGQYDREIRAIVRHLEAAAASAPPSMAAALRALVTFYRTGEDSDRVAYDIAWVHDKDSPVDTINGFVEVYMDPRGIKGSWEALVYYVNRHKTENIRKIAAAAQWFEDHMPWNPVPQRRRPRHHGQRHRRRRRSGRVGPDDAGRHQPAQRPGDPRNARQQVGVAVERERGVRGSTDPAFRREFAWTEEEAARAEKWSAVAGELTTELHEVIGHASGKVAEKLKGAPQNALKEQCSALEEARADLVASISSPIPRWWSSASSTTKIIEIVLAEYEGYARNALAQLRRVREGTQIEEDHMRNRQMIVRWLIANSTAMEVRKR